MSKKIIQLSLGILISVAILYYVLRPVDLHDLWAAFRAANWWWGIPFIAVTFLSMWVRALRWRILMRPVGDFTTTRLFSPMMIGFAINSLLPGRVGELARAYVLSAREKVAFGSVFATVVVERIFDTMALLTLLVIVFARLDIPEDLTLTYGGFTITSAKLAFLTRQLMYIGAITLSGALFVMWGRGRQLVQTIVQRMPLLPAGIKEKIVGLVGTFAEGLHSLRDFRSWISIIVLSAAVWVLVGFSMQIMSWGFSGMDVSLSQGIAITVIAAIAILIPAAPGYWGLMQLGIMFALLLLGIEDDRAKALGYAFAVHALQYFPIVFVGLFFLWRERMSFGEITRMGKQE
ncbi:hypothetical protein CVU37_08495 [candidate division BRC1 bacterium HGW-BRC1-1]|jgi:hypothetical protein|nr:MAG: hypothetical protein CVU37_08495 [candidate division BRC1 bacterium HGW-BRC1-1]